MGAAQARGAAFLRREVLRGVTWRRRSAAAADRPGRALAVKMLRSCDERNVNNRRRGVPKPMISY